MLLVESHSNPKQCTTLTMLMFKTHACLTFRKGHTLDFILIRQTIQSLTLSEKRRTVGQMTEGLTEKQILHLLCKGRIRIIA